MWYKIGVKMFYAFKFRFFVFIVFCFLFLLTDNKVFSGCSTNGFYFNYAPACDCVPETQCNTQTQTTEYSTCTSDRCQKLWWICDTPCAAPTLANDPYDYTRCPSGTALSCGSAAEAADQNKTFCGYRITCNKYFWQSNITLPAPCNQNNPVSATCNWNCSCCPTGTSRSCTEGNQYIKNITIDLTNGDSTANEVAKVTCNTHDDIFISNVKTRDYYTRWDDHLQDWRLTCRTNTCNCVAPPTATPTRTPTPTPTRTPTPTPTLIPGDWIKLKNTSFISNNTLTSNIPLVPVAYDTDDSPADVNFIRDSAGVVAAPVINITGVNINAKTGSPEYNATGYSPSYLMTPSSFLSYIKARKQHKVITSLAQINADGIYIWNGVYPLPINDSSKVRFDNYKVVFIATGQVNISTDTGLDPINGSLAIIAPTIAFNNVVEEANGIFIANNITTGSPANQGLKIVGNLIALESLTNDREWTSSSKPSLFIVFDQEKYIDLLPYLSTANYDWRQIQ